MKLIDEPKVLAAFIQKQLKTDRLVLVTEGNSGIELAVDKVLYFVDKGRKPRTKRVPISALKAWKSLSTSEAFAIQTSIFNKGIKPKNNLNKAIQDGLKGYLQYQANKRNRTK